MTDDNWHRSGFRQFPVIKYGHRGCSSRRTNHSHVVSGGLWRQSYFSHVQQYLMWCLAMDYLFPVSITILDISAGYIYPFAYRIATAVAFSSKKRISWFHIFYCDPYHCDLRKASWHVVFYWTLPYLQSKSIFLDSRERCGNAMAYWFGSLDVKRVFDTSGGLLFCL